MKLTSDLAEEYQRLWDTAVLTKDPSWGTKRLQARREHYDKIEKAIGVPWFVVGAIHGLESSYSMIKHLHNGDSLQRRTRRVPAGHPKAGDPPFTWEESALDAIKLNAGKRGVHLDVFPWHDVANVLWFLEGYNGWGYRLYHPTTLSPYLWSFTNHYTRGKYVADGKWSSSAVSSQIGAVAIFKGLGIDFSGKVSQPPIDKQPTKSEPESVEEVTEPVKPKKNFWYWFDGLVGYLKNLFK